MIVGCKSVICIDLKSDYNTKTHKKQSNKCDPCVQCMDFICPMHSTNATEHPTFEHLKRNGTSRQIYFRFPIQERP